MKDWKQYGKQAIFSDKTKGGLLVLFLKDYQKHFKIKPIVSCGKCMAKYWLDYVNLSIMKAEKIKCDYELHKKYNGIQLGVNGQPIRNGEMTNEIAKELLEKHPRGAKLFHKMPEVIEVSEDELTLKELRLKYPDIKAVSKSDFLEKVATI